MSTEIKTSLTANSNQIELLSKKIDYIKSEIQYIIDKKKSNPNLLELDDIKKEKITELESLSKEMSVLYKQEKLQQKRLYDMKSISRSLDNLEYQASKKKNSKAIDLAKEAKLSRDIARDKYTEYLQYEKEYLKYDSSELPAYIFFYEPAIEKYGVCTYINIDNIIKNNSMSYEEKKKYINDNRVKWLETQSDKGQLIYEIRDKILYKKDLLKATKDINLIQKKINDYIHNILPPNLLELWKKSVTFIEEYSTAPIKTKKLKEKFKYFINDISIIFCETRIPIHTYFSYKHKNILFHVNDITPQNNLQTPNFENELIYFNTQIEKYKEELDNIQQLNRYINNISQTLKNDLYLFLTNQKKFNVVKKIVNQKGKYFKKWTTLSLEEKYERFKSYIEYYIEKFMINENILKIEEKDLTVDTVYKLITNAYANKSLIYRDFKWNSSTGIIESIKTLKYDKSKSEFYLAVTRNNNNVTNDTSTNVSSSKKNTFKSVITKDIEKNLNEIILMFVMTSIQDQKTLREIKNDCIEHVKQKLNIKKLNNKDKEIISQRFDSISKVVNKTN